MPTVKKILSPSTSLPVRGYDIVRTTSRAEFLELETDLARAVHLDSKKRGAQMRSS